MLSLIAQDLGAAAIPFAAMNRPLPPPSLRIPAAVNAPQPVSVRKVKKAKKAPRKPLGPLFGSLMREIRRMSSIAYNAARVVVQDNIEVAREKARYFWWPSVQPIQRQAEKPVSLPKPPMYWKPLVLAEAAPTARLRRSAGILNVVTSGELRRTHQQTSARYETRTHTIEASRAASYTRSMAAPNQARSMRAVSAGTGSRPSESNGSSRYAAAQAFEQTAYSPPPPDRTVSLSNIRPAVLPDGSRITQVSYNPDAPDGSRTTFVVERADGTRSTYQNSPLVFDLDGDDRTTRNRVVAYDIDGDGAMDALGDISAQDGILVLDTDKDGIAGEDARELFGDGTDLDGDGRPDGWANGFEALRALVRKAVRDGKLPRESLEDEDLDSAEFERLGLRMRIGGLSGKTVTLDEAGVRSIRLSAGKVRRTRDFDGRGNDVMRQDGASFLRADGSRGRYEDVWLSKNPGLLAQNAHRTREP